MSGRSLLVALADESAVPPASEEVARRCRLLLADFLACVCSDTRFADARSGFASDGASGVASHLAVRASSGDRDDVDWQSLHHPGSVVLPVVLALGAAERCSGEVVLDAIRRGYTTAATIADAFESTDRSTWHLTATAGAVGAASAASVVLGLDASTHERALALAVSNVGGLARAARERRGAASFNRAAAVALGVAAARGAVAGAPAVDDPLAGGDGIVAALGGIASSVVIRDGVLDASIRVYPVSGFLQTAVRGAASCRDAIDGELISLRVGLPAPVLSLVTDSEHGAWWDVATSVLRAWGCADPFDADVPHPIDGSREVVSVVADDLPNGCANVSATTSAGVVERTVRPMLLDDPLSEELLAHKWRRLEGVPFDEVLRAARSCLESTDWVNETRSIVDRALAQR